jgi:hypothetical protein
MDIVVEKRIIKSDIHNIPNIEISKHLFTKMSFIYNAVQNGWNVKKKKESYIFTKKHQGKKEVFLDTYLNDFVEENVDLNKLLSSSS